MRRRPHRPCRSAPLAARLRRVRAAGRAGLQPWQAWTLVALLLLAQGLGLAHRTAHAPALAVALQGAHGPATASAEAPAPGLASTHGHEHGDHEPGGAACRLIDHAAQADAPVPVAVSMQPPAVADVLQAESATTPAPAPRRAAYLARAPPQG